jgi:Flp pilus assembly protein CpaB
MTETSRPIVNATRARQAIRGTGLIWVLVISTFLAAAGLFAAWMWRAPQLAHANSDNGTPSVSAPAAPAKPTAP